MLANGEVTEWIRQLETGNREAAERLWEGYYRRLVGLARKRLRDVPRREMDEEDVALSAFDSFCRGVEHGRFPRLESRDDLWNLLLVITVRKSVDFYQRGQRLRRGSGKVRGESAFENPTEEAEGRGIEQIVGREPTPEFAAEVEEQYRTLLELLESSELRSIAVWKMEGRTNKEVAELAGRSLSSVERKLSRIRSIWTRHLESS